jgi:phosphoglycerate dehydrogenase-like enzyme
MRVKLAMYDKGLEHIGKRLDALNLGLKVHTFSQDGRFLIDGASVAPEEVDVDYMWLNANINIDNFQEGAFNLAQACRSIGVLQTFNAGLDHPFYKRIAAKGTRICNSSAQSVAISEYVFAHVLSLVHPIDRQRELQAARKWEVTRFREVAGTHWMIVGFGPIGRAIAQKARAFGARTTVIRRSRDTQGLADAAATVADIPAILPEVDVIVLACPLNAETRGLAGNQFFSKVKKGAILVNIARGGLIDDAALLASLDAGRLEHAVLDVFHEEPLPVANPFWTHPKVRMTSHTSFAGSGVRERWDNLFLDNIARFVRGEKLVNEVDPGIFD